MFELYVTEPLLVLILESNLQRVKKAPYGIEENAFLGGGNLFSPTPLFVFFSEQVPLGNVFPQSLHLEDQTAQSISPQSVTCRGPRKILHPQLGHAFAHQIFAMK